MKLEMIDSAIHSLKLVKEFTGIKTVRIRKIIRA